jgi:hypothetical protein
VSAFLRVDFQAAELGGFLRVDFCKYWVDLLHFRDSLTPSNETFGSICDHFGGFLVFFGRIFSLVLDVMLQSISSPRPEGPSSPLP